MVYLDKTDIILINKETVETHGGNYMPPSNFLHESNLDYLIEAVQAEMFGQPLYPNIADKASVYCYNIICNHIFTDGNKRTGLESGIAFLKLNNMRIRELLHHPNNELLAAFTMASTLVLVMSALSMVIFEFMV